MYPLVLKLRRHTLLSLYLHSWNVHMMVREKGSCVKDDDMIGSVRTLFCVVFIKSLGCQKKKKKKKQRHKNFSFTSLLFVAS